jgi:hypothetical protein
LEKLLAHSFKSEANNAPRILVNNRLNTNTVFGRFVKTHSTRSYLTFTGSHRLQKWLYEIKKTNAPAGNKGLGRLPFVRQMVFDRHFEEIVSKPMQLHGGQTVWHRSIAHPPHVQKFLGNHLFAPYWWQGKKLVRLDCLHPYP